MPCGRSSFPSCRRNRSGQIAAIGCNDLFVPVCTLFFQASAIAGTIVLIVHIDKAITLCHFAGGRRHKVDAAPHGIAHPVDAIFFHGGFHRLDMAAQVVDAAAVVDGAMPNTLISSKVSQYFTLPV